MENKNKYPRFIQSKPCGVDKFDGKSQERLTKAIAHHISSTDEGNGNGSLPRIIGLEGGWGVGKSNVIKQLKGLLHDTYYLFEYDAWGHQEDLQRRSFLEQLTSELISEKLLTGQTIIKIKGGNTEVATWGEKLKYLLARKTETKTERYPRLSWSILVSLFIVIFTPLCIYYGAILKFDLLAIMPIGISLLVWLIASIINEKYRNLNYLLAIYSDKIENDICYETISEKEPTVSDFKAWMQDISDNIKKNKTRNKIIVVFDNMDRLPAEKVKELWSSIHTFFTEGDFENIWAIIPFDEKHLSYAFGECKEQQDEQKQQDPLELAKSFISKTFPIVYRVTPPINTDFKKIFNILFEEAFGKTEINDQEKICRKFKFEKSDATIRDMIIFINQLVTLKLIWGEEIGIFSMAIFILKRDMILENIEIHLLSNVLSDWGVSSKDIAALVYGVSPDDAEQIHLSRFFENCLKLENGHDINEYIDHKHSLSVLKDIINESNIPIDTVANGLSRLSPDFEKQNKDDIMKLWDSIAKQKLCITLKKQEFDDTFRILLIHTSQHYQREIVGNLCTKIQQFSDFNGQDYYTSLSELDNYVLSNNLNIHLELEEFEVEPDKFIDYISIAGDEYLKYKLRTNITKLDDYIANNLLIHNIVDVLNHLKTDKIYKFDKTIIAIEMIIKNSSIDINNFKKILDIYKILSEQKPLPMQLNNNLVNNIWNTIMSKQNPTISEEYLEIIAIQMKYIDMYFNGHPNHQNIKNQIIKITLNEEHVKIIAKNIGFYAEYGDLLLCNLVWNVPILNQVLKCMTENKLGYRLSLLKVLPKFFEIKTKINVTEITLLEQLERWNNDLASINKENVKTIVPNALFFQYSSVTKNTLTDHLNKIVTEALSTVSSDTLYLQRTNLSNDYWFIVINNLIDTDYLKNLPNNLIEFGKKILDDIAGGRISIPNTMDLFQKIINKLNRRKTAVHIKDIRNKFCNGLYVMNIPVFKYFELWFEQQGDLLSRSAEVVPKIIEPVIDDSICLGIILSKSDYYAKIVNDASDNATDFREKIKEKLKTNNDNNLIEFARKIGISHG